MQIAGACLPVILKQFAGQDLVPGSASSNNSEMQLVLSQVLSLQQQILTTQQAFNQRLMALESQAVQQFTSLNQQVQSIKSIRLSHSKETKAIDYNLQQEENN